MVSPRTGEEIQVSAKTASTAVKVRPLAGLTMARRLPGSEAGALPSRHDHGTPTDRVV